MSRRRTTRRAEELGDELLADLEPVARHRLLLEAEAEGNDYAIKRLRETCPKRTYRTRDSRYTERARTALSFRQIGLSTLQATVLELELLRQRQRTLWCVDLYRDGGLSAAEETRLLERDDRIAHLVADLYAEYHAQRRFAEEILGVELETWFAPHPEGDAVLADVTAQFTNSALLADAAAIVTDMRGSAADSTAARDILDALADERYEASAELWAAAIEGRPPPDSLGHD